MDSNENELFALEREGKYAGLWGLTGGYEQNLYPKQEGEITLNLIRQPKAVEIELDPGSLLNFLTPGSLLKLFNPDGSLMKSLLISSTKPAVVNTPAIYLYHYQLRNSEFFPMTSSSYSRFLIHNNSEEYVLSPDESVYSVDPGNEKQKVQIRFLKWPKSATQSDYYLTIENRKSNRLDTVENDFTERGFQCVLRSSD